MMESHGHADAMSLTRLVVLLANVAMAVEDEELLARVQLLVAQRAREARHVEDLHRAGTPGYGS